MDDALKSKKSLKAMAFRDFYGEIAAKMLSRRLPHPLELPLVLVHTLVGPLKDVGYPAVDFGGVDGKAARDHGRGRCMKRLFVSPDQQRRCCHGTYRQV